MHFAGERKGINSGRNELLCTEKSWRGWKGSEGNGSDISGIAEVLPYSNVDSVSRIAVITNKTIIHSYFVEIHRIEQGLWLDTL